MADIIVTPYDQSHLVKNPQIVNLNYTNQDFWSLKSRLVNFMNERFGPTGTVLPNTFNDLVEGSIAIMLMENWAFMADTLSFKIDQIANEIFIDTVTQADNAFRLAKLVGFDPTPPISARTMWIASLNNPLLTDIRIPAALPIDIVAADTPIRIELFQADANKTPLLDADIIIPAGATSNQNIVGLEGRTIVDTITGTGETGQTYQLSETPVIYDSIRLTVDGILWEQVDYFTDSKPRKEYRVEFDSDYNGFIIFGNNRAGLIPSSGSIIQVKYRVGGGTVGNIVTGFVETQTQIVVPGLSYNVPVGLRNYTKGEFGYDGDTIEQIRIKLPLWVRTQDRAVSGDDYKILSDQFATPYHGQIGKATATLRNYGCAANIVDIYILAKNGEDGLQKASDELKVDLIEELNTKKMFTDFVCIKDGSIIQTDVQIDLTLDKFYQKFELELTSTIQNKVKSFFALNNWDYGQSLRDTDVIKELSDIKEIQSIDITFTTADPNNSGDLVTTKFFEIIRPDQTTISFMYT